MEEAKPKGYISSEFTVWCALCPTWYQITSKNKQTAMGDFQKWGWQRSQEYGWLCQTCKKKPPTD